MTTYPPARRLDLTEEILGHQVADPYRWLEEPSQEREEWLLGQGELFERHRETWTGRETLADSVRRHLDVGAVGTPVWRGDRCFYARRDPGQEHAVLYSHAGEGPEVVLIDPMAIDQSGLTTLDSWQPDKEGRLLAYQLSTGGDEESRLFVLDVSSGALVDGPIDRCRYTVVAWLPGGKAFYYVRRLPPDQVPDGESQYHRRLYLHQIGTTADGDVLIFGDGEDRDKTDYYFASVSMDGRWLAVSAHRGTAPRNDLWLADLSLSPAEAPEFRAVTVGLDAQTSVAVGRDGLLYVFTDYRAPRGRLCVTSPSGPLDPSSWQDLIPQSEEAVLRDFAILDAGIAEPALLASWTRHAISEITVHSLATGLARGAVPLPGLGTVGGLSDRPEGGHEAWFLYTDYLTPPLVLRYDGADLSVTTWAVPPGGSQPAAARTEQISYQSADGTTVRMVVISPGGGQQPRPTILNGYGGFSRGQFPAYSAATLAWVTAGGVFAVAGLRGGSEEGEDWHRAGMLDRKQNVFDDFRAAADCLVSSGITSTGQLAIYGGSNGGLLTGATLTQHPGLCSAVVCSAPLLDMVRYERFGLGQTWNTEYGTAADPAELGWLLAYSPYHQVTDGTPYPAVLFTVFTSDTRVDPLHAYKMCAALQHATTSGHPVLLRAEGQVGHGARSVSRSVDLAADELAFMAHHTGLRP